jgi:YD repeat-containing protein
MTKTIPIAAALLAVLATDASAQSSRTFYDSAGRVSGRSITDSAGSTTIYDSHGRITSRTAIDSAGIATIYDAHGRAVGKVTAPSR